MKEVDIIYVRTVPSLDNYDTAEPIAVAAIRTNPHHQVMASYSSHIMPLGDVDADSTKRYSFNRETWATKEALSAKSAFEELRTELVTPEGYSDSYVVIAYNPESEQPMFKRAGDVFLHDAWLSMLQLAWPLAHANVVKSRALNHLAESFKLENRKPGTAEGDVHLLSMLYPAMMRRYKTSLVGEEAIRDMGGGVLDEIRNFMRF